MNENQKTNEMKKQSKKRGKDFEDRVEDFLCDYLTWRELQKGMPPFMQIGNNVIRPMTKKEAQESEDAFLLGLRKIHNL